MIGSIDLLCIGEYAYVNAGSLKVSVKYEGEGIVIEVWNRDICVDTIAVPYDSTEIAI